MRSRLSALLIAFAGNVIVAVVKFIIGALSGSAVMIAEGIHSTVDAANEVLLLVGQRRSRRPAHSAHPFGHGKEIYVWGFLVAVIAFASGGGLSVLEGLHHLRGPQSAVSTWAFVVLGVELALDVTSLSVGLKRLRSAHPSLSLWRATKASKDPSLYLVVVEDAAAIVGLVLAAIGLALARAYRAAVFDGTASIAVGVLLAAAATFLANETRQLLVGERASRAIVADVRRIGAQDACVRRVGAPLTMQLGPREILLNLPVRFKRGLSEAQIVEAIRRIERRIRAEHPDVKRIFIEPRGPAERRSRSAAPR